MFEKIGQSAETIVSRVSVSRRGFLGTAAKVAAGVGAVVAGLAAFPTKAQAGEYGKCCWGKPNTNSYYCESGFTHAACDEWGGKFHGGGGHGGGTG